MAANLPYVDKTRIGAAGASYGGYMVDWLLGHNDDPRFKIKTFVSHAGVYNLESMAGATEELWFVNWEFKGMPWQNGTLYQKWSPHKFAAKFNTPTLVTAGEIDYRVPVDQRPAAIHRSAAQQGRLQAYNLPRRRPLDTQTAKLRILVFECPRLAR